MAPKEGSTLHPRCNILVVRILQRYLYDKDEVKETGKEGRDRVKKRERKREK